jgi:regulator of replication initiation timing
MNLANEVSTIMSELESLRATTETLKHTNAILEFENSQLRGALEKAQGERDHHMVKKAELKTLLDQCGASLVAGIQKFHESNRAEQLEGLRTDDPPVFLAKPAEAAQ